MALRLLMHAWVMGLGLAGLQSETRAVDRDAREDTNTASGGAGQTGSIVGSKHDFGPPDWKLERICLACHTLEAVSAPERTPLWDHSPMDGEGYTLYASGPGLPGPASLVCLSCHDGSTAVDAYGSMSGGAFTQNIAGNRAPIARKADVRRDHPVGVAYPEFDSGYRPRAQIEAEGYVVLPQGRVECLSCHDVHCQYGVAKLLVKPIERGALCLTCHRK